MRYWRKPLDSDRVRSPRGEVRIIVERCKGCGFCVEYCPRDVLVMSEDKPTRQNRLGLLQDIAELADGVVDLSLLEGF